MRGPEATLTDDVGADVAWTASGPIGRLRKRADFLHAAKGARWHGKALSLQTAVQSTRTDGPRIGFTLTKKVGCAVVRNRARRRLREAVRLGGELPLQRNRDYVIVGRIEAVRLPMDALRGELADALRAVHRVRSGTDSRRNDKGPRHQRPVPAGSGTTDET